MKFMNTRVTHAEAADRFFSRFKDDINIVRLDNQNYARVDMGKEVELIVGSVEEAAPHYFVSHDYKTGMQYVQYARDRLADADLVMPNIAPYASEISTLQYDGIKEREFEASVINYLELGVTKADASRLMATKVVIRHEDPIYDKYVDETNPKRVGFVFNPFTVVGARMLLEIKETPTSFVGVFKLRGRHYDFCWKKKTDRYIVNPNVWSCVLKDPPLSFLAFSLSAGYDFWTDVNYKVQSHIAPFLIPVNLTGTTYVKGRFGNNESREKKDLRYDISNNLGRVAADGKGVMPYGAYLVSDKRMKNYLKIDRVSGCNLIPDDNGTIDKFKSDVLERCVKGRFREVFGNDYLSLVAGNRKFYVKRNDSRLAVVDGRTYLQLDDLGDAQLDIYNFSNAVWSDDSSNIGVVDHCMIAAGISTLSTENYFKLFASIHASRQVDFDIDLGVDDDVSDFDLSELNFDNDLQ
jgi:hypothetical protein